MKYMRLVLVVGMMVLGLGCSQTTQTPTNFEYKVIKHSDEIEVLRKHIAEISENSTFPRIVEPLQKSTHNPDRFEFIRADSALREKYTKRPSATHITYYYLIRIHFRGENAFGALRVSYQDYHLYPSGKIQAIEKKK